MTDDARYQEIRRWVERHDLEFKEQSGVLADLDERLDELERREAVQDMAVALVRWMVAVAIPIAAILFAVWKG